SRQGTRTGADRMNRNMGGLDQYRNSTKPVGGISLRPFSRTPSWCFSATGRQMLPAPWRVFLPTLPKPDIFSAVKMDIMIATRRKRGEPFKPQQVRGIL